MIKPAKELRKDLEDYQYENDIKLIEESLNNMIDKLKSSTTIVIKSQRAINEIKALGYDVQPTNALSDQYIVSI